MKFTVTKGQDTRLPKAAIDEDGDLHIFKGDGSSLCLTKDGPIFDYSEDEIADLEMTTLIFPGDTVSITF